MEPSPENRVNVADRLAAVAAERPDALAVVAYDYGGMLEEAHVLSVDDSGESIITIDADTGDYRYAAATLGYLNHEADTLARGLMAMGIGPGKRIALLVRPGIEFVTLVFALLRTGATMVLVDAGLGRKNIVRCLASTEPDGFVAIPLGHAMRVLKRKHFPKAKLNVTVGRRWLWGGETLESVRRLGRDATPPTRVEGSPATDSAIRNPQSAFPHTTATDPAAICFTSGSTGPPKGVLYTHQTFVTQCDSIQRQYDIRPGDVDLACFPLFGLFNVACGVTTVLPEMDFSRPASCDPKELIAAANQWKVTQAFASPAVWDRVSRHCEESGDSIPTLKKVLSCGAPVPAKVLRRTLACVHPEAEMHTPYGATESLPVATIEAKEILDETAAKTDEGAGVCVGKRFDGIEGFEWRVIKISDDPIATIDETEELPTGDIGELIVKGPQVSRAYLTGGDHNAASKIADGADVWHRIGDVGYFDEQERFWYCGRKSQRVVTREGTLFTECVENIFVSRHSDEWFGITKAALVGVRQSGDHYSAAVLVAEPTLRDGVHLVPDETAADPLLDETDILKSIPASLAATCDSDPALLPIKHFLTKRDLPVDIRHNSKIRREELAVWAEKQLKKKEH